MELNGRQTASVLGKQASTLTKQTDRLTHTNNSNDVKKMKILMHSLNVVVVVDSVVVDANKFQEVKVYFWYQKKKKKKIKKKRKKVHKLKLLKYVTLLTNK